MLQVELFSMQEVLLTPAIGNNKTKLSKVLGVTRNTVNKYEKDTLMLTHCVFFQGDKWVLRAGVKV